MKSILIALITTSLFITGSFANSKKPYTKNTCIVSDNELGSMGKVITKVHEGQEVKFCCKPCVKKFDKNPAKFLKDL